MFRVSMVRRVFTQYTYIFKILVIYVCFAHNNETVMGQEVFLVGKFFFVCNQAYWVETVAPYKCKDGRLGIRIYTL